MAESLVQVTEGSGKKLHTFQRTIGANNVEDEVVLQGEPYLASYVAGGSISSITTATANAHLAQLMAGASLKVRIRRIEVSQTTAATTATLMQLQLFRLTSAGTGGSSAVPSPLDTADSAAGATFMTLPTAKGTEDALIAQGWPYMMQTIGASAQLVQPIWVWEFDTLRLKPLIIPAGTTNGIAIKCVPAVAAGAVHIDIWFSEANF